MPSLRYRLHNDDCRKVLMKMKPCSVDTVITDPPYGLKFMGKDWDHGIPGVGFWTRIMRVCKPGAMLLAFGGTRTYHRLTCAIEDAGWEIRDCMMWLYGSGFPKSANISKNIDKAAGVKFKSKPASGVGFMNDSDDGYNPTLNQLERTGESTDAAKLWEGWGTALTPAYEPIVLAMKPLEGTFADNALEHGVAGINVDGGRIGTDEIRTRGRSDLLHRDSNSLGNKWSGIVDESPRIGRWPKNVLFQHHPACVAAGVKKVKSTGRPNCEGKDYTGSSPEPMNRALGKEDTRTYHAAYTDADGLETVEAYDCHKDCPVRLLNEQQKEASRFFYCAKAPKRERNEGLEGMEKKHLATMGDGIEGREHNPDEPTSWVQNNHPTVKPLKLMEYLCTLTKTPTGGVVLDPFMGSGTTGIACANTGRKFIGMENDTEHGYFEIAKKRIEKAYAKD